MGDEISEEQQNFMISSYFGRLTKAELSGSRRCHWVLGDNLRSPSLSIQILTPPSSFPSRAHPKLGNKYCSSPYTRKLPCQTSINLGSLPSINHPSGAHHIQCDRGGLPHAAGVEADPCKMIGFPRTYTGAGVAYYGPIHVSQ